MSLVPSLLQAIVRVDGEALVIHTGDKPYVVAPTGQVELASRGLTLDAVVGIVSQLLPTESLNALDEFGAIQYDLPTTREFPGDQFTVVAARGGDDVWMEIRRRQVPDDDLVPEELFGPPSVVLQAAPPPPPPQQVQRPSQPARRAAEPPPPPPPVEKPRPFVAAVPVTAFAREDAVAREDDDLALPDAVQLFGEEDLTEQLNVPTAPPPVTAPVYGEEKRGRGSFPAPESFSEKSGRESFSAGEPAVSATERRGWGSFGPAEPFEVESVLRTETIEPRPPVAPPAKPLAPPVAAIAVPPEVEMPPPPVRTPAPPAAVLPLVTAVAPPRAIPTPEPVRSVAEVPPAPLPPPVEIAVEPIEPIPAFELVEEPVPASEIPPPLPATPIAPVAAAPTISTPPLVTPVAPVAPTSIFEPSPATPVAPVAATPTISTPPPVTPVAPVAATPIFEPPPPAAPPSFTAPPAVTPPPAAAADRVTQSVGGPGVVVPLSRSPIRSDTPPPVVISSGVSGLDRLLRMAAARGASTLYLSSHARPSVRVDGEIQLLEGEPVLGPHDVDSLLITLMPERNHEALRSGVTSEWIADLEDVGRVRCMSFRDHLGSGGVFRMMPTRAVSTEQLGLSREIQSLAIEPEGLVLVAGPRLSGKRTMISALVDLINRARRDHVITIESEINVVHERGTSFISQREVRGGFEDVVSAARAALREDPDVLIVESLRTAPLINVALEAAASGQLVIGGFPAHNSTAAIDRIINLYPAEYRRQVQLALAENLRGVVAQVLLRKSGGGRLAAREVLLNTPNVASVIAEGRTSQLPMAIEGGRRQGMMPMNDALVGLVQSGAVDMREAYRRATDRVEFFALLKRHGMDTSPLERLA